MPLLETITVASPCTADWDAMQGDERVRFCGLCELNVYNLSALPRDEAEAFVREAEGKVCVRMYKRRDGTLLTQDCPVGLRAKLRRKLSWLAGLAASALASVGGVFLGSRSAEPGVHPRPLPVAAQGGAGPVSPPPQVVQTPPAQEIPPPVRAKMGELVRAPSPAAQALQTPPELIETLGERGCEPPLDEELTPEEQEEPQVIYGVVQGRAILPLVFPKDR